MDREEALEIIRKNMPSDKSLPVYEAIQTLIPELAESEDEKIRKELIELVRELSEEPGRGGLTVRKTEMYISYLEKQKINTEGDFGRGYDCGYQAGYAVAVNEMKPKVATSTLATLDSEKQKDLDKMIVVSPEVWDKAISDAYENGKKDEEKQKEQKPLTIESAHEKFVNPETLKEARTNKYIRAQLLWELMHNGIITEVDYQYLTDDKRKPWTAEEYNIAYQKGFEMSEQLKQKEQKPAEHSAKGRRGRMGGIPEYIRKKAENFLSKMEPPYDADDICTAYEAGALESAKPAGWSEEDEKMLRTIISDGSRGVELDSKQISFLKSLRPSWKPSEEQMEAVKHAYNSFPNDCSTKSNLRLLYHDLEKLGVREEPEYYQHFDPDC